MVPYDKARAYMVNAASYFGRGWYILHVPTERVHRNFPGLHLHMWRRVFVPGLEPSPTMLTPGQENHAS